MAGFCRCEWGLLKTRMADAGQPDLSGDELSQPPALEPVTPSTYLDKLEKVGQLMLDRALRYYRWGHALPVRRNCERFMHVLKGCVWLEERGTH